MLELYETRCPMCHEIGQIHYTVWHENIPATIRMECKTHGVLTKKAIDEFDRALIEKIQVVPFQSSIKNTRFIENSRINILKNKYLTDFFTKRNHIILTRLMEEINAVQSAPIRSFLKFMFSSTLRKTSKLISTKGGLSIGFWIPKKNRKEKSGL